MWSSRPEKGQPQPGPKPPKEPEAGFLSPAGVFWILHLHMKGKGGPNGLENMGTLQFSQMNIMWSLLSTDSLSWASMNE